MCTDDILEEGHSSLDQVSLRKPVLDFVARSHLLAIRDLGSMGFGVRPVLHTRIRPFLFDTIDLEHVHVPPSIATVSWTS